MATWVRRFLGCFFPWAAAEVSVKHFCSVQNMLKRKPQPYRQLGCPGATMASANNQLRREMDSKPGQEFDIENIDPSMEKIIEMNVGLVELNDCDTTESDDDSECEDSSICEEVTEENIKFSLSKREGRIEMLDGKTE